MTHIAVARGRRGKGLSGRRARERKHQLAHHIAESRHYRRHGDKVTRRVDLSGAVTAMDRALDRHPTSTTDCPDSCAQAGQHRVHS